MRLGMSSNWSISWEDESISPSKGSESSCADAIIEQSFLSTACELDF
jgi:hypothetical protein